MISNKIVNNSINRLWIWRMNCPKEIQCYLTSWTTKHPRYRIWSNSWDSRKWLKGCMKICWWKAKRCRTKLYSRMRNCTLRVDRLINCNMKIVICRPTSKMWKGSTRKWSKSWSGSLNSWSFSNTFLYCFHLWFKTQSAENIAYKVKEK